MTSECSIDLLIAKAMWEADDRPCEWISLSRDEKQEWETMARAARLYLISHMQHAAKYSIPPLVLPKDHATLMQDLVRRLSLEAIAFYGNRTDQ